MARPRNQSCIDNHGPTPPRNRSGACKLCVREYKRRRRAAGILDQGNRPAQRKRDKARKRAAIADYRAACGCRRCGTGENLHLHHRDPASKTAEVSALIDCRSSWTRIWEEVAKCDVLCATCHTMRHHPGWSPPAAGRAHGDTATPHGYAAPRWPNAR
jgi:hypothetical protein